MNYQKIFENALRKLNLQKKDVKDWKPAGDTYVPEIGEIKGAVVILMNDGREFLFWEKAKKRFIEIDTTDTIGDLVLRLTSDPRTASEIRGKNVVHYYIDSKTWRSPIPSSVLYPEGSDYE